VLASIQSSRFSLVVSCIILHEYLRFLRRREGRDETQSMVVLLLSGYEADCELILFHSIELTGSQPMALDNVP
jgi:hypothetical protein